MHAEGVPIAEVLELDSRMAPLIKRNPDELACFGAQPAFAEALHVGKPNVGDEVKFLTRAAVVVQSRRLTNRGPLVCELEQRLSELLGARHCILVANGTVGLEVLVRALGLQGEVIVPSFTFVATAHALQWLGVTPVFCDVGADSHTIDPRHAQSLIGPRTTGIIGVHTWGRPCAIGELAALAEKRGLALIFDAAHAFACSHRGQMVGNFGAAEVFSFHATKFFNTFEGGAIATNDEHLAARLRLMINFGFADIDDVRCAGTNGKMTEISAAMGLTNLESLADFVAQNRERYRNYCTALEHLPGVRVVRYDDREKCNYQYVVLEIDENRAGIGRDLVLRVLRAENVLARRYFYPGCHGSEPYRTFDPSLHAALPHTVALASQVIALPTGTSVSQDDVAAIAAIVALAVENCGEVSRRLRSQDAAESRPA